MFYYKILKLYVNVYSIQAYCFSLLTMCIYCTSLSQIVMSFATKKHPMLSSDNDHSELYTNIELPLISYYFSELKIIMQINEKVIA